MRPEFETTPKLGFGCMRLPLLDPADQQSIDLEQFKQMVDAFKMCIRDRPCLKEYSLWQTHRSSRPIVDLQSRRREARGPAAFPFC